MPNFEVSVLIDRPVEDVFAFVEDPANDSIWRQSIVEAEVELEGDALDDPEDLSRGGEGLGATGREVYSLGGMRIEATWEIVGYEPNRKVVYRSTSGPVDFESVWSYESVDAGTRLEFAIQWDIVDRKDFGPATDRVIGRTHRQNISGHLQTLKKLLEA